MKIRNSRTGEYIVIHEKLNHRRKRVVWDMLGLPSQLWRNKRARDAFWKWYCAAPLDFIFINTGYEVRMAFTAILVPPQEYIATAPSRRGDT